MRTMSPASPACEPPDESCTGPSVAARCESDRVSTRVIRSIPEIEDIRRIWTSWQQHPNADIDFYLLLCRVRPEILRPHIIVISRGGRPEAMLIGRLVHEHIDLKVGYSRLSSPRGRVLNFLHGGLLGNLCPENSEVLVREITASLGRKEADVVRFVFLRTDCPLFDSALNVPGFFGRDHFPTLQMHWSMRLPKTIEEVYRGLSADHRGEIRRKTRKILADYSGSVRIQCLRETADLDRIFRDVEEIARKTYQRGLRVGFEDTAEMRQILRLETGRGQHRTYILYINDKPCAFWMGTLYGGTFYTGPVGYDPSYRRYSPGTYLLTKMIEDFCNNGVGTVDFGLGDAEYKQRFGNLSWQEGSVLIFGAGLRGLAINAVRTPAIVVDRLTRRALEQSGLLSGAKKIWRGLVQQKQRTSPDGPIS
jgi:GNAT acetyltransferase-like protein